MANLIPDVSGNLRINTVGAMGDYQNAMKNIRDAVASPGDLINRLIESNERDKRAAEEQKRYETELGFKQRQEGRVVDELNRAQATREAVQATLNPEMYRSSRLGEVDTAIQQGLANLTPQERSVAEQEIAKNYNREASGRYVLDSARNNVLADPTAALSAQANQLSLRLKDPNSAEFKAAQQAEWDAAKRKMDYNHGLDMAKLSAQEKRQLADGDRLAALLNVGNTKTQVSTNQGDIDAANKSNAGRAYAQEQYGREYARLAESTPMLPGESMDAYGQRLDSMAKTNIGVGAGNKITDYALVDVPELKETTRETMMTPQEYSNIIYKQLANTPVTPATINQVNSVIKNYTDAYNNQNKAGSDLAIKSATLNDYKAILNSNKVDTSNITTVDGAKAALKTLEAKMKANKTGGGVVGVGPLSLDAMNVTGLDASDRELLESKIASKNISDKDLAAVINTANQNHTWTPTMSSTQRKAIEELLESYPNRK